MKEGIGLLNRCLNAHSFCHLFNKYFLSNHYVHSGVIGVKLAGDSLSLCNLHSRGGERDK